MKRLTRTIEIISYRHGKPIAFIYSKINHFADNTFEGFNKYITLDEVNTHLNTGSWHKITGDRAEGEGKPHRLAIQVVEHDIPFVPHVPYKDSTVNTGDDEFTRLFGSDE